MVSGYSNADTEDGRVGNFVLCLDLPALKYPPNCEYLLISYRDDPAEMYLQGSNEKVAGSHTKGA